MHQPNRTAITWSPLLCNLLQYLTDIASAFHDVLAPSRLQWFRLKPRFSRLCVVFHTAFSLLYSATCAKVTSSCEHSKLTGNHARSHPIPLVGASFFPQSPIPITCPAPGPRLHTEVARIAPYSSIFYLSLIARCTEVTFW